MLPNIFPVLIVLGFMGWMDIPLDYIRLMIASVAIGISVDDAIHYMTRLRHEFRETGSYEEAIRRSVSDVGRALVITSIVLVAGFMCWRILIFKVGVFEPIMSMNPFHHG